MSRTMLERYQRWYEYEKDAHQKVLSSLASVPAERRDSEEYRKAVDLLGHVVAARRVWLERLGRLDRAPAPLFPKGVALDQLVVASREIEKHWDDFFRQTTDDDLERFFNYTSLDGKTFRNRIDDVLTQLYGHSLYHRGQIAMLVRKAGGEPAVTDFVYWCREPAG